MTANSISDALTSVGLVADDFNALPASSKSFADGAAYRVEIPSVEGPAALRAVIEESTARGVTIHRVSQGSGIQLLSDAEITDMVSLGADVGLEVCLFTGPRAGWDTGVQATSSSGRVIAGSLRGTDQLRAATADVYRASALGIRSALVADLGLLWVLGEAKSRGDLPADLVLKVSISLPVANAATARVLEDLGANSLNLPVDLSLGSIAAIRDAVDVPVDMYIEAADDFGGTVRYSEIPELVRIAAPIYLKFTVRNAPGTYPAGLHIEPLVLALSRERVRRAAIGLEILTRSGHER
jgi:hypothetical protein